MKKLVVSLLLILFYVTNLFGQTRIRPEEYAVYASVLRVVYKDNHLTYSNKSHFVILNVTNVDPELDLDSSSKFKALFRDFNRRNLTSGVIEARFPLGAYSETYYLVAPKEIDELFEKGQAEFDKKFEVEKLNKGILNPVGSTWMPFYEKYPEASGYYSLSRVGFNGSFAMVQVKRNDIHTGFTRAYILKKVKGKWKIVSLLSGSEWVT
jgi:hypothetical protein